jgi:menaquinone-dependent protoporphyrinogen IX oxidase
MSNAETVVQKKTAGKPRVLLLYYSFTHQAEKVAEVMATALTERGCEVDRAAIEFTDSRYRDRFSRFPWARAFLTVVTMLPAQLRRATGEIGVPEEAKRGDYDLVVVGSPTWWLTTNMPIRSYLKSDDASTLLGNTRFTGFVVCRRYWKNNLKTVKKLGSERGGDYVEGVHFRYPGGQIRSLLSLISYLGSGEYRERFLGVKIPPTNLQPEHLDQARQFATSLADGLVPAGESQPNS